MKILQICKAYFPENVGGVEQLVYNLTSGLHEKGIHSDVLTITRKNIYYETVVAQSKVYAFPQTTKFSSCPISFRFFKAFKAIAKSYDLLNYHFPWPFADFVHIFSSIDKPFVITYHSDIVKQFILQPVYYPLLHSFFKRASNIITTSYNLKKTSTVLRSYQGKTKVIHISTDEKLRRLINPDCVNNWKLMLGDEFDKFFLLIGVLRYYKGVEYLLEAVCRTNLPLVVIGSGPKERKFRRFVRRHKMKNVIFVGKINDVDKAALLSLCHAVVSPAHLRSEAFCIALLEGLLFQKPLISTEIGTGTSFVNMHNITGLVVPPKKPAELRNAMQLLVEDKALYNKFQQNALQRYKKYFTNEIMIQEYIDIYKSIN